MPRELRSYEFRVGRKVVHIGISDDPGELQPTHRSEQELLDTIISRFRERGFAQVPGYKKFGYLSETANALLVSRESGKPTRIPHAKLRAAILAARQDPNVYDGGPSTLREHGITHINSPLWALLHLVSVDELMA